MRVNMQQPKPTREDLVRLYQALIIITALDYVLKEIQRGGRLGGPVKQKLNLVAKQGNALMETLKRTSPETYQRFEGYSQDNMALILEMINKATQVPPHRVDWFVAEMDNLLERAYDPA